VKELLALLGAALAAVSTIPYLIDVVRRKTKPNIVTWLTWTMLTVIAGSAALVAGEPKTAIFLCGNSVCTGLVVLLGLKYGTTKFSRFDILCQCGAILSLVLWLVFKSPTVGIVVPLIIDFVGLLPTLRHSWQRPDEETWQSFLIGVAAPALTILSLTHYNIASLVFPLYLFLADGALVLVIVYRRKLLGMPLGRAAEGARSAA
jgi:D-alanyl-lipoteichoic acid acyltransferase DltB (MBOAT superfamily)